MVNNCCHIVIVGEYDILENQYSFIICNDKEKVVASPKPTSKLLMDVVTVGHTNICINEAGCLINTNVGLYWFILLIYLVSILEILTCMTLHAFVLYPFKTE